MFALFSLQALSLARNRLGGPLPAQLPSNLTTLYLASNQVRLSNDGTSTSIA